jgi:hypothetical protein
VRDKLKHFELKFPLATAAAAAIESRVAAHGTE